MKRYSLVGIYPISEDLQPGDVLLDVPLADGADPQPRVQRLGSLHPDDLLPQLMRQEESRLRLEPQKPAKQTSPAATDTAKPAAGSIVSTSLAAEPGASVTTTTTVKPGATRQAQPGKPVNPPAKQDPQPATPQVLGADTAQGNKIQPRLRRVALPAVTAARIYDWQIGGAGPIGRAAVALGLAGNGSAAVLVHLHNLELAGFDTLLALDLEESGINGWIARNRMTPFRLLYLTAQADPLSARRICRGEDPHQADERAIIRVVNRVLYAHDIEYEYTRSSEFAGKFAADIAQSAATRAVVPSTAASTGAPAPGAASSTTGPGAIDAEAARVAALTFALAGASPTSAGVRATLGVGTFGNVALKEHHDRPMAVGFVAATSFAVRNSLVLSGGLQEAERQLEQARDFCSQFFTKAEQTGSMIEPGTDLSKIENIICYNTDYASKSRDRSLPSLQRCARVREESIKYEWSVGRPRRDSLPHSVF